MTGSSGLDAVVTVINESEPFNFLYKKNQETNWIKNNQKSTPANPKIVVQPRKQMHQSKLAKYTSDHNNKSKP